MKTELLAVCVWDGDDAEVKEVYLYPIHMDPAEAERDAIADMVVGMTTPMDGEDDSEPFTHEQAMSFIEEFADFNVIRTVLPEPFANPAVIKVIATPSPEMRDNGIDPYFELYRASEWTVAQAISDMKRRISDDMSIPRRSLKDHYTVEASLSTPRGRENA